MSEALALIAALEAEGVAPDAILRVVKATFSSEKPRSGAARRQADYRARQKAEREPQGITEPVTRDVTRDATEGSVSPNDIYSNPLPVSSSVSIETPTLAEQKPDEVEAAVAEWNALAAELDLPSIRGKLTGPRRSRLKARLAEHKLVGFREALAAIRKSPFCRGEVNDFRADLGFLTRPENFTKLLEGGFAPKTTAKPSRDPPSHLAYLTAQRRQREEFERRTGTSG